MVKLIENKKKRGGARPGSGQKRSLEGGKFTPAYIDDSTREILSDFGEGNLSGGIRIAAIALCLLPEEEYNRLLKRAREIVAENIERVKESQRRRDEPSKN